MGNSLAWGETAKPNMEQLSIWEPSAKIVWLSALQNYTWHLISFYWLWEKSSSNLGKQIPHTHFYKSQNDCCSFCTSNLRFQTFSHHLSFRFDDPVTFCALFSSYPNFSSYSCAKPQGERPCYPFLGNGLSYFCFSKWPILVNYYMSSLRWWLWSFPPSILCHLFWPLTWFWVTTVSDEAPLTFQC